MPVFIDNRGKGELMLAELLKSKKIPVEVTHLESGDIIIEDVGIERKTINDLIGSVIGKQRHLWKQLETLKNTYKKPLVIIEGHIDWNDRLTSSVVQSIAVGYGIPYISTYNIQETVLVISRIFDRYGSTKTSDVPPPSVKRGKTTKEIRWCMLQTIPRIGVKKATEILKNNPKIFSRENYKLNLDIKGLNKESKKLLEGITNGS